MNLSDNVSLPAKELAAYDLKMESIPRPINGADSFSGRNRNARAGQPSGYPIRQQVSNEHLDWRKSWAEYHPPYYVAPTVLAKDRSMNPLDKTLWADPEMFQLVKNPLRSFEPIVRDADGKPLNPHGRTGLVGRGLLGCWGANFAADPIVTRVNSATGSVQIIAIRRTDNNRLALPGGMVDAADSQISTTLARELREETGVTLDMSRGVCLFQGYVDDPRNTDNAWIETTATHLHLAESEASQIEFKAGDDASAAFWLDVTPENLAQLYADHGSMVRRALARIR